MAADENKCWLDQWSLFDRVKDKFTESTYISRRFLTPLVVPFVLGYMFWMLYIYNHVFLTDSKIEISNSGCHPLGALSIGDDADFRVKLKAVGAATLAANPALSAEKTLSPGSGESVSLSGCIGSETYVQMDPLNEFSPLSTSQTASSLSFTDGTYEYMVSGTSIVKMHLVTGETTTTSSVFSETVYAAVHDEGYGYFSTIAMQWWNNTDAPKLVKIDLSTMTQVGNQTFATYDTPERHSAATYFGGGTIRSAGSAAVVDGQGYGYFNFNARVYKVKLATMETPSYAQLAVLSTAYESCGDAVLSDDKQYG